VRYRSDIAKKTNSSLFSRTLAEAATNSKCRMGDVAQIIRGVTFNGSDATATPSAGKLPVLRAGNIQDRLVTDRDLIWVPESRISQDQRLRQGDIVIAMSSGSAAVVGKSAILDHAFAGSVGAFCAVIRPSDFVDPAYFAELLRSRDFVEWRDGQTRGASIQNLRVSELGRLELPVPSKSDQRLISERLQARRAAMDRAAASLNEQAAALDALHGALLRGAFEATDSA
jgi:type I restriction enzyme S subunit